VSNTEKLPEIPGYDVKRLIGQGGMASVYLAEQLALHRLVALKLMATNLSTDDSFTARFLKEGATAANLAHPKIIKVFDSGVHKGQYYIAMEYLSGGTLKDKLKHGLPLPEALQILKDMADALRYAHEHGVIHRDIKSQNILLYPNGTPILSDFGVAKALDGSTALTRSGMAIGSPGYMSPEQLRGLPVDGRSDLYALGILFYEMLVGELPYQASDQFAIAYKHIYDPLPELPPKYAIFQPILDKTLAKTPDDRVANADALLALIEQIEVAYYTSLSGETRSLTSDELRRITLTQEQLAGVKKRRAWPKISLVAVLLVALGGGGIYYYSQYYSQPQRSQQPVAAAVRYLLNKAEAERTKGQLQDSLASLRQALALAPSDQNLQARVKQTDEQLQQAQNLLTQAQQAHNENKFSESLALIEQGLQIWPQSPELLTLRDTVQAVIQAGEQRIADLIENADSLRQSGDYEQSLQQLAEALTLSPDESAQTRLQTLRSQVQQEQQQFNTLLAQAEQEHSQGQWQNSLQKLTQALALAPNNTELQTRKQQLDAQLQQTQTLLTQAQQAHDQSKLDDSLSLIQQGLEIWPQSPELLALRNTVQTAIHQREQNLTALAEDAKNQFASADYQQSLHLIEQILAAGPDESIAAELQTLRAQAQDKLQQLADLKTKADQEQSQGRLPESLAALDQALAIAPNNSELQSRRDKINQQLQQARSLLQQAQQAQNGAKLSESLDFIQQGLQIWPQSPELLALRNTVAQQRDDWVAALLEEANILFENKQYQESLNGIEQALRLSPNESIKTALLTLRDKAATALQQRGQNLAQLVEEAQKLFESGDYEQSVNRIDQALSLNPNESLRTELQALRTQAQDQQQQLIALIQQANEERTQGRLQDSLATLDQVLALIPNNSEVQTRRGEIDQQLQQARSLLNQAQQAQNENKLTESLAFIQQGLQIWPQSPELLALRDTVQSAMQQHSERVTTLFNEAKTLFEDGNYKESLNGIEQALALNPPPASTSELQTLREQVEQKQREQAQVALLLARAEQALKQNNATLSLQLIDEGLKINAQHNALLELRQQIQLAELLANAEQALAQDNFELSLERINQGLQINPQHAALLALRQRVQTAKAQTVDPVAEQIDTLLANADRQMKALRLTTPAGDAAFETYQAILQLDAQNQAAREGIQSIADKYFQWARKDKNRKRYDASLQDIGKGLQVAPEHSGLLALRSEVTELRTRYQQEQARLAKERAAQEKAAQEKAAREATTRQTAAQERAAQERAAREQAAREQAARDKAAREAAARQQAAVTSSNQGQRTELQSRLKSLKNELKKVEKAYLTKDCDYAARLYGKTDTSYRRPGCPTFESEMNKIKSKIAQVEKQLKSP